MNGAPEFIANDPNDIITQMVKSYEEMTGKILFPAQPERLIFQVMAYRETLIRSQIQYVAEQNLVEFSQGIILDNLGRLVGVDRLPPDFASVKIQFVATDGHPGIVVPEGTRIGNSSGQIAFRTDSSLEFEIGEVVKTVFCTCMQEGPIGNGHQPGEINVLQDPQTYIVGAQNIVVTAGGSDIESDESLRKRIKLAPSVYSTAGSIESYQFHALSANANIVDVEVSSPTPGHVNIYPLMLDGGITPQSIIAAVIAKCSPQKVRPLTDTVNVIAPTRIDYVLTVNLTLLENTDQTTVLNAAQTAVSAYVLAQRAKLGQDITEDQITAKAMVAGVYSVELPGFVDLIIDSNQYGFCNELTVQVIGLNEG